MVDHKAVMACGDMSGRTGYLCNCGRTILGKARVDAHFAGVPMSAEDVASRRMEGFTMFAVGSIFPAVVAKAVLAIMMGEGHG